MLLTVVLASLVVVGVATAVRGGLRFLLAPKPSSVSVVADPGDALIAFGRFRPATGRLALRAVKAGRYRLLIRRKGFVDYNVPVRVLEGRTLKRTVALKPRLFEVAVRTRPSGVNLRVVAGDGKNLSGATPFERKIPAGPLTITMKATGYNTVTRRLFLAEPAKFDLWMDPKGLLHHTLNVFGCGPSPKQVAFTRDGKRLWVSTMGATGVEVYDWRTGKRVGRVDLGPNGAVEVMFTRDGKKAYVSQMQTASVFEIATSTLKRGRQLRTRSSWTKVMALSPDEKLLYAANWSGDNVTEIDVRTGKVLRQIPTVDTPRGLYVTRDGKKLFVAGFEKGDIQRINLRSGSSKVLLQTGGAMRHLVPDEKRRLLYADDMSTERVYVIDLKTEKVRTLARTDRKPNTIDITPDGKILYVSNRGENGSSYYLPGPEWGSVLALDARTGKALDAIVGGNQCTGLDVSDDGRYLAFSDFLDGRIHVYEIPEYQSLASGGGGRYKAHFAQISK